MIDFASLLGHPLVHPVFQFLLVLMLIGCEPQSNGTPDSTAFDYAGGNEGFRSYTKAVAIDSIGVVILANSDYGFEMVGEIMRSLSVLYEWGISNPDIREVAKLETKVLNQFVGEYLIRPDLPITLRLQSDQLIMETVWDSMAFPIYPDSDTSFFAQQNNFKEFVFSRDDNGSITSFSIDGRLSASKKEID